MTLKEIERIFQLEQVKLMILIGQTIMNVIEEEDLKNEKRIEEGMKIFEKTKSN